MKMRIIAEDRKWKPIKMRLLQISQAYYIRPISAAFGVCRVLEFSPDTYFRPIEAAFGVCQVLELSPDTSVYSGLLIGPFASPVFGSFFVDLPIGRF